MKPNAPKIGIIALHVTRQQFYSVPFSGKSAQPTMEDSGSVDASAWTSLAREFLVSTPMDVIQTLMFLLLRGELSAFGGFIGSAPSAEEVEPLAVDDTPQFPETSVVANAAPDLNLICRFDAKFVAKSGWPIACTVELQRVGWNRRRLRITKSDSKAVLIDCEIDRKSKAKVAARANVNVLAETKEGSGRLSICSLAFATTDEAQQFVRPFS
jgi:hypothetical protein